MSGFAEFCARAQGIYGGIRENGVLVASEGVRPDPAILREMGGYGVVLRHGVGVTRCLEKFSARLAASVGGVKYAAYNAHTSVCIYDTPQYRYSPRVEDSVLRDVARVVRECVGQVGKATRRACKIRFTSLIYNQHSVVAPGEASQELYDFIMNVVEKCQGLLAEFKPPWGGHMTVYRFTEAYSPEQLVDFLELLKNPPAFGESRLTFVDTVHFMISPLAFSMATVDRVEL